MHLHQSGVMCNTGSKYASAVQPISQVVVVIVVSQTAKKFRFDQKPACETNYRLPVSDQHSGLKYNCVCFAGTVISCD